MKATLTQRILTNFNEVLKFGKIREFLQILNLQVTNSRSMVLTLSQIW